MQVIKFKKLALTLLLLLTIFEIFLYAIYLKYGLSKITSNTTSTKLVPAELMSTELLPTEFVATELVPTELVSTELVPTELLETEEHFEESNSELDDEFLVNTLGCKMTRLPVMTPNIQEYFKPPNKIVCLPPAITESDECKK